MKDYQVGDLMYLPMSPVNKAGEYRILHIPQHPSQMWVFQDITTQNTFGVATGSPIVKNNT